MVTKLVYNLFRGRNQPTYIRVIYNPVTKYHGHPTKGLLPTPNKNLTSGSR